MTRAIRSWPLQRARLERPPRTARAAAPARLASGRHGAARSQRKASRWRLGIPFLALHLAVIAVIFTGWTKIALLAALASYMVRALGITAFYHRCFAHRSFRVPRPVQLAGAVLGASAAQRGPLWWVAHHRQHHVYTDRAGDPHSPVVDGFWYSHVLWIFDPANAEPDMARVQDLARFPEIAFLDRYEHVVPVLCAASAFGLGAALAQWAPSLGTSGWQLLIWGFVVPTVALYHSTFAVNSLAHRFGRRRFQTADQSRNNWLISALVLGEGWHNNHHRFPNSARQGLTRFELDPTWWAIRALGALGLASDIRRPPPWSSKSPAVKSPAAPARSSKSPAALSPAAPARTASAECPDRPYQGVGARAGEAVGAHIEGFVGALETRATE